VGEGEQRRGRHEPLQAVGVVGNRVGREGEGQPQQRHRDVVGRTPHPFGAPRDIGPHGRAHFIESPGGTTRAQHHPIAGRRRPRDRGASTLGTSSRPTHATAGVGHEWATSLAATRARAGRRTSSTPPLPRRTRRRAGSATAPRPTGAHFPRTPHALWGRAGRDCRSTGRVNRQERARTRLARRDTNTLSSSSPSDVTGDDQDAGTPPPTRSRPTKNCRAAPGID